MSKKNSSPPFVMVTNQVLDSPAWRAMSHGAGNLYVALKRRYWPNRRNNGKIYLSHRQARKEIRAGASQIVRWFSELQHYGFIVMMAPGCLGVCPTSSMNRNSSGDSDRQVIGSDPAEPSATCHPPNKSTVAVAQRPLQHEGSRPGDNGKSGSTS